MSGSVGDNRAYTDLHFLAGSIYWFRAARLVCARQGNAQREGSDAMLLRRTIGISLACLVTSACAIATESEESTARDPGDSTGVSPGNAEMPAGTSRSFTCGPREERRSPDHGSRG